MEKVIYGSGPDPQHCRLLKHMGREVLKIFKFGKLVLTEDKYRSGQENQKKTKKREEAEWKRRKRQKTLAVEEKKTGKLRCASHRRVSGRNRFARRVVFTPWAGRGGCSPAGLRPRQTSVFPAQVTSVLIGWLTDLRALAYGSGSCSFRQWLSKCQQKISYICKVFFIFTYWLQVHLHQSSSGLRIRIHPNWIRIQSDQWIRIRNPYPYPGGQKWITKVVRKKFHVLKCWMFSFENWRLLL